MVFPSWSRIAVGIWDVKWVVSSAQGAGMSTDLRAAFEVPSAKRSPGELVVQLCPLSNERMIVISVSGCSQS